MPLGQRSFLRHTGLAQAKIYRLLAQIPVLGTPDRVAGTERRQRVRIRFQLDRLGQSSSCLVQFALEAERTRQPMRNSPPPRICRACSSEEIDCLIDMP